ncbi:putative cytochrome P450 120 isoform X5 [Chiloscyllium punctatum]|uniref:putative cytochrome P450 120 isoform X5 n=1 Tax=Chiloscyllium punctatum TaxID=137246 RepID=UPI003B63F040
MSQIRIPGTSGYALMSDKSLEFYKDPMHFCNSRIHSYGSRVFQARLLNKPTIFVCSVKGMKELLCARMSVFEKDPSAVMHELYGGNLVTTDEQVNVFDTSYTTSMCKLFGDTVCFTNGLISAPVKVKVSVWSSAFTQALEAKGKLLNIINERLKSEEDGLISKIKTIPFPENTSAAQHLLLFISALIPKAVASLLTSFTVELAGSDKTDLRKRAQESEDYLNHVLLEVERLWPSFIGGRRIAKQDTTLCGYVVPKGYLALFVAFAVHRDPEIFDDPDEFQPERWSGRNAGQEKLLCCFGNGSRNCIGIDLNNVILKATAGYLLNHYCWELDPPNQNLEYKWLPVSRPAEDPKIKFTSCSSKT